MSFLDTASSDAKQILQRLDKRFQPRISSLLIPRADSEDKRIGLSAGSPFNAKSFHNVPSRSAQLVDEDPGSKTFHAPDPIHGWTPSHEQHVQAIHLGIQYRALQQTVTEAANAAPENEGF